MKQLISSKSLFLADFASMSALAVREWMVKEFQIAKQDLEPYQVLAGAWDDGSYEGTVWFLLRSRETGHLFEVHGGHCSCYGFEDQFKPEPTDLKYIRSDKFGVSGFRSFTPSFQEFFKTL